MLAGGVREIADKAGQPDTYPPAMSHMSRRPASAQFLIHSRSTGISAGRRGKGRAFALARGTVQPVLVSVLAGRPISSLAARLCDCRSSRARRRQGCSHTRVCGPMPMSRLVTRRLHLTAMTRLRTTSAAAAALLLLAAVAGGTSARELQQAGAAATLSWVKPAAGDARGCIAVCADTNRTAVRAPNPGRLQGGGFNVRVFGPVCRHNNASYTGWCADEAR